MIAKKKKSEKGYEISVRSDITQASHQVDGLIRNNYTRNHTTAYQS